MNMSDLERVVFLSSIKEKCEQAQVELQEFIEEHQDDPDPGGIKGYEYGYWANFSTHKDGSGKAADFSGCYIGVQAARALMQVADDQISRVCEDLHKLGVNASK